MRQSFQALPHRELPVRPAVWALLGPGLVWMALAQGSGELIWWPYLIAKYGLGFLFLLIPASLLQFPLTFEIARYTVLTGEGIFRGFFRLNRWYGGALWVLFTLSFLWFGGFASAGGTALAHLTQFPNDSWWTPTSWQASATDPVWWTPRRQMLFWGETSIVFFTLALLYAKTAYRLIEWVMKCVALVSLFGMLFACCHPDVRAVLGDFTRGLVWPDFDQIRRFEPQDTKRLLTAITFAGLGGFWTLFYSYWIKEKGIGMASHTKPIQGFRSGATPLRGGHAQLPSDGRTTGARLQSWYRYLTLETAIGTLGNLATTLMTCLLAYAILHPQGRLPEKFEIAVVQAEFFALSWGDLGRFVFLFVAGAFLADTWLATVDCVTRVHLDALDACWPGFARQDQRRWYYGIVLLLAVITSITMLYEDPANLIILSAVIGVFGTVLYSAGLMALNHGALRRALPADLRPSRRSLIVLAVVSGWYLLLAVAYLYVSR